MGNIIKSKTQISNLANRLLEIPICICNEIYAIIDIIFPAFMKMLISAPISC